MKRIIIISIFTLFMISNLVYAQKGVQIGLVLQPSLQTIRPAWLSSSGNGYDPDFNQTLRAAVGACLDYHVSPYLGVGANIEYSAQGQKFLVVNDSGNYQAHFYKFNFIKVPIFLSFNSGGKVRILGHIGPELQILAGAKDKYNNKDHDIIDNYAPLNLGINFGFGIGFMLGQNAMFTAAPNFDITFLNYNYTTFEAEKAYLGKSPVATTFGLQFTIRYVKNEVTLEDPAIK